MGRIKSAWEIALERTESIEVDADKIRHSANIDAIRRIAGAYMLSEDNTEASTREKLASYTPEDLKEGLGQTILNTLVLNLNATESDKDQRACTLLDIALPGDAATMNYLQQIQQHINQYPLHMKQLLQQLKEQFEPRLQEKARMMKEQYGEDVPVSFENDKECQQLVTQYSDKLTAQYQEPLDEAKAMLKVIFGC
ncbi:MAG: hypothetical protein KBS81_11075 [Spirochaetales bacterium]|nr:hypothetical protein [Candidatus Physcosoma equi]